MHPRLIKQASPQTVLRILAYTAGSSREDWILNELSHVDAVVQVAQSATQVIAALTEDRPPLPAMLVVDFDHLPAAEMLMLHTIRERGWCGEIVAVGTIPMKLRSALGISRVVAALARSGALADEINKVGFQAQTIRIPVPTDVPLSGRGE